jgi:inner membrane protein
MENLTHSLTGLMMSRAGLNRVSPRATALLVIAANSPDIDIVSWFGGSLTYLEYHRAHTHSILMAPLMALLPVALVALFTRSRLPWFRAWSISLLGVVSHVLLDWTNTYGIRMLLPISSRWLRLDTVFIVDVWIWALFAFALAAPAISRLVSSEIGAKPGSGRAMALFVLAALSAYEYSRYILHERALATLEARLHENTAPSRVFAFPHPVSPLHWTGVVEGERSVAVHNLSLLEQFDPAAGTVFYKPPREGPVEAVLRTDAFQRFLQFSQVPLWRVTPVPEPEGAVRVEVVDLRFGTPPNSSFWVAAIVDRGGSVIETSVQIGVAGPQKVD